MENRIQEGDMMIKGIGKSIKAYSRLGNEI